MRSLPFGRFWVASWIVCSAGCRGADTIEVSAPVNATLVNAAAVHEAPTPATEASCGNSGLPDCPLQRWMKGTLQAYQRAGDHERMARALGELAQHAPPGYAGWQDSAERGAKLAASHDDAAIKQVCKDCHQNQRARYRKERRSAPVW
jgi:hypothetical protein